MRRSRPEPIEEPTPTRKSVQEARAALCADPRSGGLAEGLFARRGLRWRLGWCWLALGLWGCASAGVYRHDAVLAQAAPTGSPSYRAAPSPRYRAPAETKRPRAVGLSTVRAAYQKGIASLYGRRFHGDATASGEPFDMHALTAAHGSLPFDTQVRVTNLENGKSVVVRINDRGPYRRNRVIDLSYGAAQALGMIRKGTARVALEILNWGMGSEPDGAESPDR